MRKVQVHLSRLWTDTRVQDNSEQWEFSGPQSTANEKKLSLGQNVTNRNERSG